MAIIIDEQDGVSKRREVYAAAIHIHGNPVDKGAGSIQLDIATLHYYDGEFDRMTPSITLGELVGDFASREFTVDGKTITGLDVVRVVEQYTSDMHAAHVAATEYLTETPIE